MHGIRSNRMKWILCYLVLVLALAIAGTNPAVAAPHARADSTPLDGVIFQDVGIPDPLVTSGGFQLGCEGTQLQVTSAGGRSTGTTIRSSDSGWRVATHGMRPASAQNAQVGPTFTADRQLVGLSGYAVFDQPGGGTIVVSYLASRAYTDCAALTEVAVSPAGAVYQINWNAALCDNSVCSASHTIYRGDGCLAFMFSQSKFIAATVQLGGCTADSFPVPSPPAEVSSGEGSGQVAHVSYCVVPNVRRKRLAVALRQLRASQCGVGKVRREYSATVKSGYVLSQSRRSGERLRSGTRVDLSVSVRKR
jgi:hypothetical protein